MRFATLTKEKWPVRLGLVIGVLIRRLTTG
jgi:hypothetical protein